jgi:hypothetical protein
MEKQILRIERRIAQLERQASRTLTASDKSWLANKFDELESWVLGTRRKNKKSLSNIREAFVDQGVKNPKEISKWVERAKTPRTLMEKEVKNELDKKNSFKDRVEYLSDTWESRFEKSLDKQAGIVYTADIISAAIVYGLLYAVAKSIPGFGLAALAFMLIKIFIVAIVLVVVLFDLKGWEKMKRLFSSKARPQDVKRLRKASLRVDLRLL